MGTITPYESAKGRRYRVRYRKPDRTETEKRGFTTMRDAKLFLSTVTVSKAQGDYIDPALSKAPVSAFAEAFLRSRRPPMLKPSSYAALEHSWRKHVEPVWAHREIASIRRSEVQEWVADLASRRSRSVVLRALGILAGILDVAIDDRRLANNPARRVRNLPRHGPGKRRVYLSHEQVSTLAACSPHPTLVLVLAYTGLRWGEATALRVRAVNRQRRRLNIEENAVMIQYEIIVGTPKTHEKRSVPYPAGLDPLIAAACAGKGPEGLLFGDGEHHMRNSGAVGWFANSVRRAQVVDPSIPRLTPHDLRHTAASLAISSGANVKAVQRMLGHASAAMTLDTYADLFEDDLDAVASSLNAAMTAAPEPVGAPGSANGLM
ncbi:tyrosine-type recombinase/integrase [Microbacterium sulfonylureivorans]|uniref:tyrosine-type recombinase/integrase n=1 Tax=Microbacterium sulfonylureivorans TaxID=2486854 RepID=UPI000FD83602|nr:site-specific integrase [Microbacterium sulfonylureivorans]